MNDADFREPVHVEFRRAPVAPARARDQRSFVAESRTIWRVDAASLARLLGLRSDQRCRCHRSASCSVSGAMFKVRLCQPRVFVALPGNGRCPLPGGCYPQHPLRGLAQR